MSAHVAIFPEKLTLERLASTGFEYGWPIYLLDETGNRIHLTEALADELAQMLWNRNLNTEKAA